MRSSIAVDIGGTFTDLVYYDETTNGVVEAKVPTVPDAPEQGVLNAIRQEVPIEILRSADYFVHGTTVGLNALIERRGARVGLLATEGFRDSLEIRLGNRTQGYDLFWRPPAPLVPRRLRLGVHERVLTDGTVHREYNADSVTGALEVFGDAGVDSIAVCLLNSYANPVHELAVERTLRDAGYTGPLSLSHRLSRESREYQRTSTAVIDAFVRARIGDYLEKLETELRVLGFKGECLITRNGGDAMTFAEAKDRPFETINSGPVGGVQGAAELARRHELRSVILADVGGTTFDTSAIIDSELPLLYEGSIGDMPILSPWVDVRSVGAGGGSIVRVDVGGHLQVGPQSSGSIPGPAAYGNGGTDPTITDCSALLGMLGPGHLASGLNLDFEAAARALEPVAAEMRQDLDATAVGALRVSVAKMAHAMIEVSIHQGHDPREMTLIPFGGAGPLIGVLLADELGIDQIVVPVAAGNFSAVGMLSTDLVQAASRSCKLPVDSNGVTTANDMIAELFVEAEGRGGHLVSPNAVRSASFDMRYAGQLHSVEVTVPLDGTKTPVSTAQLRDAFVSEYEKRYQVTLEDEAEIRAVRVAITLHLPRPQLAKIEPSAGAAATGTHDAYSFKLQKRVPFSLIPRGAISGTVDGPAIITEATSTLYLDAGWEVSVGANGDLSIHRKTETSAKGGQ